MAKLYSDIDEDIIKVINQIDFSNIREVDVPKNMEELERITSKHVELRKDFNVSQIEFDIPQRAADFLNKYAFNKLSKFKKNIAEPFIIGFLQKNNLLKR